MSVLTYLYPRNLTALCVEQLLPATRKTVKDIAIAELGLRKNATPDWESLSFVHPSEPSVSFLFVVARNTKPNIVDLENRYPKSPGLAVVRSGTKLIWAKHKESRQFSLKGFQRSWAIFDELIAVFTHVGDAMIDSPENERLFTPSAFRRQQRKHSKGQRK